MRVILADEHAMLRDGLRAILERAGICVVGEAATGHESIALAIRLAPDVLVMDIGMPKLNGIDATRRLRRVAPNVKVIALSMRADRQHVLAILGAGAVGYLLKNASAWQLIVALEAAMRGDTYLCPGVADLGLPRIDRPGARSHSGADTTLQRCWARV